MTLPPRPHQVAALTDLAAALAMHDRTQLARGLHDLDQHNWGGPSDYDSLRQHYRRDAERFLLPHLTQPAAGPGASGHTDEGQR